MIKKLFIVLGILFCLCDTIAVQAVPKKFETMSITELQQSNLMKLSSMYGYARYFYPNSYINKMDWHQFLLAAIPEVMNAQTDEELQPVLLKYFTPIIPQLKFSTVSLPLPSKVDVTCPIYLKQNITQTGFWMKPNSGVIKKIDKYESDMPIPDANYSFPLSNNLYANYPLALTHLPSKTTELKSLLKLVKKMKWVDDFYTSPYFRIANAIISNNVIQHFYAYYDENNLQDSWNNESADYLMKVASCTSYQDYLVQSYQHFAPLKDSHVALMHLYSKPGKLIAKYCPVFYPNFTADIIENKVCISNFDSHYKQFKKGDVIEKVNGLSMDKLIQSKLKEVSASTLSSAYRNLCLIHLFRSFKKDSVMNFTIKHSNNQTEEVSLIANIGSAPEFSDNTFITDESNGIWRVNLCSEKASYKEFAVNIPKLKQAKGIVFDLRGYPYPMVLPVLANIIDSTITVGNIYTPVYYYPNHQNVKYIITANSKWGVYPASEPYQKAWEYDRPVNEKLKVPFVFLTDSRSISFGETIMEMIKHYKLGTIVGEPTAGTNGDVCINRLPAMGHFFTARKFKNHDDSQHYGIGVLPDVYCPPTIKDIQNGIDTQLEKAKQILLKQK